MLLAGGVGGARLARGLAAVLAPEALTIVVNVGDDSIQYGAHVAADIDTVAYTLAGINGPHGWGIAGDTHVVIDHLAAFGEDTSFRLGDRDLAHCLARTMFLAGGGTLSAFTARSCADLGLTAAILPASDDPIRTKIRTNEGELLDFQDYFVRRRQRDTVSGLEYAGAEAATPAPGVIEAIEEAAVVIIAPSNPPLSVWPILAISDLAAAVRRHPRVVAVSPLIGGEAVKGPLVAVMKGLGLPPTNAGIAAAYDGFTRRLAIDTSDSGEAGALAAAGVDVLVTPTLIPELPAAAHLAAEVLSWATGAAPTRASVDSS